MTDDQLFNTLKSIILQKRQEGVPRVKFEIIMNNGEVKHINCTEELKISPAPANHDII